MTSDKPTIPLWKWSWRFGFAKALTEQGLHALRDGIKRDDPRLIQGSTTTPPPLMCVQDWPVEAACAAGYCGWQGEDLKSVGQVELYFATVVEEAARRLDARGTGRDTTGARHFLNWFDDTPRAEMLKELLPEVERELRERGAILA